MMGLFSNLFKQPTTGTSSTPRQQSAQNANGYYLLLAGDPTCWDRFDLLLIELYSACKVHGLDLAGEPAFMDFGNGNFGMSGQFLSGDKLMIRGKQNENAIDVMLICTHIPEAEIINVFSAFNSRLRPMGFNFNVRGCIGNMSTSWPALDHALRA